MNIQEKRDLLVQKALSRKEKNRYSQDVSLRTLIERGYGDCSGTVWYWYKKLFGINIGANTQAQINSPIGKRIELNITNGIPDETKMRKGDLLYFRGSDNSRTEGVGHVEMYIGGGQIFGHGSGIGGTVKNMRAYCLQRQNAKSTTKATASPAPSSASSETKLSTADRAIAIKKTFTAQKFLFFFLGCALSRCTFFSTLFLLDPPVSKIFASLAL